MKHQNKRKLLLFLMFFMVPIIMNVLSPVVIILASMEGIFSITFYAWTIMFISSFFVGRAFCSYICPYGGLQMIIYEVSKKKLVKIKRMKYLRFFMGIVWLGLIIYSLLTAETYSQELLYNFDNLISVDNVMGVFRYYLIIGGATLIILLLGRNSFCKYICPMAILNTIGSTIKNKLGIPSLKLTVKDGCIDCKKCNKVCTMTLDVNEMVNTKKLDHYDCTLCGECVEICPKDILKRKIK